MRIYFMNTTYSTKKKIKPSNLINFIMQILKQYYLITF